MKGSNKLCATSGSYNPLFGSLEMKPPEGEPRLFVIAGSGMGIETYRMLQRKRIPFITGILHESDIDYQVAFDLASLVVAERGFVSITKKVFQNALDQLRNCDLMLSCLRDYGEINARNRELYERGRAMGCKWLKM